MSIYRDSASPDSFSRFSRMMESFLLSTGLQWRLPLLIFLFFVSAVGGETQNDDGAPVSALNLEEEVFSGIDVLWKSRAAEQALSHGFSAISVDLYRQLLEEMPQAAPKRAETKLMLVSALIANGDYTHAEELLETFGETGTASVSLRRAMLAWRRGELPVMEAEIIGVNPLELDGEDRAWYSFSRALLEEMRQNKEEAESWYRRAVDEAVSQAQRGQFLLALFRSRILSEEPTVALANQLAKQVEAFHGRMTGFHFAQQYALVLDMLGQKDEAIGFIRDQIQIIPREDAELRDQFLFLEGAVSGRESGRGRESFRQLLESGSSRSLQRIALQQIVSSGQRGFLREALEPLIEKEEPHPLLDELLVSRAQAALLDADYGRTIEDAERVLAEFPGSRLKGDALRLLASVAWEQGQFRTAADYLTRLQSELTEGRERRTLGVLVADCFFRAEDYVNAADAYGIALRDNLEGVSRGLLLYQRVLAELRAGRLDRAEGFLGEFIPVSVPEGEYRWQAEWNLVKTMQQQGRIAAAFERLEQLLAPAEAAHLPESLLLRFQWLLAQLSHEAGDADRTIEVVDDLLLRLSETPFDLRGLSLDISLKSHALLLKAQALFTTNRPAEAIPLLGGIRREYSGSRPAIYSYLVEARHHARAGHINEAQEMLLSLAEVYKSSEYAPIALYEAAANSRRSGAGEGHQERAIALFEKVVNQYPAHDLAFYARIHQGDILRELNRFGAARQVYESLANNYPDHPDWFRVRIALADSHLAQAVMGDAASFRRALVELERLFDLPNLTSDMRAEAGFKYAFAYEKSGSSARAEEVYWLLISAILHDDGALSRLGPKGRYWLSRSIFELGRLFEQSDEWDKAREIYGLIFSHQLPGLSLVEARLALLPSR